MSSLTIRDKCKFLFDNVKAGAIGNTVANVAAFFFLGAYPILESKVYGQTSKLRMHTEKFDSLINYGGIKGVVDHLEQILGKEGLSGSDDYQIMKDFRAEFNPEGSPDPALTVFMSQFIYFRKEKDGKRVRSRDPVSLKPLFYNDAINGDFALDLFIKGKTLEDDYMGEWIPRTLNDGSNYDREEEGMAMTYHTRPVIVGLPRFMLIGFPGKFDHEKLSLSQGLTDQYGSATSVSVTYKFLSVMVRGMCFVRLDGDTFFDFETGNTVDKKHVAALLSDEADAQSVYILMERDLDTPEHEEEMGKFCREWIANQGGFRHWTSNNEIGDVLQESLLLKGDEDVEDNVGFYHSARPGSGVSSMEDEQAETDVDDAFPANGEDEGEQTKETGRDADETANQTEQSKKTGDDSLDGWDL